MNAANWLDHLPPWLGWGAIATTGAYSPGELALMAAPLLLAALAQARAWPLLRWRRLLELAALAGFLAQVLARTGLLPTLVHTLFLLCAARLALPRALPERRQILLMGFLLFLTTAISTTELDFLAWALLWVAGAGLVLLQQSWGQAALCRQGPPPPPPFRLVLPWTALALVLAAGFFVIMPRLRLGFRGLPVGAQGIKGAQAGLSESLALDHRGPIELDRELALRLRPEPELPEARRPAFEAAAALLRCFAMEALTDQRWEVTAHTPPRPNLQWNPPSGRRRPLAAQLYLAPTRRAVIPLPYGDGDLEASAGDELTQGRGGALRLAAPAQRIAPVRLELTPRTLLPEPQPAGKRLAMLTAPGLNTGAALRWSLRVAPGDLPPLELAERLSDALRGFRYTLDNPSGAAPNPLEDFLERSRAGHCEYFASALAIMLRQRGVPSRIASGYRLGPWNEAGGYFAVTQAEAHSWVEYYDPQAEGWRVADPTPAAPPSAQELGAMGATFTRWADVLRFQWDRRVLRFSGQDQGEGLAWLQTRAQALAGWRPGRPKPRWLVGAGLVALLAWTLRLALRPGLPWQTRPGGAGRIRELAPLARQVRRLQVSLRPLEAETAQAWLARLAQARPERAQPLAELAREADAVAYGGKGPLRLTRLARTEARAWK